MPVGTSTKREANAHSAGNDETTPAAEDRPALIDGLYPASPANTRPS